MLKNISRLGRTLNKAEQKMVNGSAKECNTDCVGKAIGTLCWGSAQCDCPGICARNVCEHE